MQQHLAQPLDPTRPQAYSAYARTRTIQEVFAAEGACRFQTSVDNDLRTEGVVIDRRASSALDLDGLDLERLIEEATSSSEAAASRKLVIIGRDGVATHQMHPNRRPTVTHCGQATLAVLSVLGCTMATFTVFGPDGRRVEVTQWRSGTMTHQSWRIKEATISYEIWRGHLVAQCQWLNNFAVVHGTPSGVTLEQARRELFNTDELVNKLVIVERQNEGAPHVTTETAAGTHGAIPASGAATLAVLALRSVPFGELLKGGVIAHPSKAGDIELPLPPVVEDQTGDLNIDMPSANVTLSPLEGGR